MTEGAIVFWIIMCVVCYYGERKHGARAVRNALRKEIDR